MKKEDQDAAKEIMVKYRSEGMDKKDCAILAGIERKTLYRWFDSDDTFATRFKASWFKYKRSLIKGQKSKDPWKLLTSDFKERFQEKELQPQQPQNIYNLIQQFNIGGLDAGERKSEIERLEAEIGSLESKGQPGKVQE